MKKTSFYGRWGFWILMVVALLLPPVIGGALRSLRTNRNDVREWLPASYQETAEFNWFLRHFAGGQFVLMSWDGCTLSDPRLRLLAEKLVPPEGQKRRPNDPRYFERVITGRNVLDELMNPPNNLARKEALARLQHSLIGPNGEETCLVVTFSADGEKSLRKTVNYLIDVAERECNIPRASIHMGGPPVDNVALDESGERSLMRLAGVTGIVGLFLSWWCLRSWKLIVMVFSSGIFSAAASLAVVWYSGGQMNSILLTMPALVYVAAISGSIHLANYYRDAVNEHGVEGAAGYALAHAALPLSLAAGTTAIGLASLAISDLVPIQMFGIYSAIGVIISLVVQFLFLPAALEMFPLAAQGESAPQGVADFIFSPRWANVGQFILRHNVVVSIACLSVMVACAWGTREIVTSVKLMNFFRPSSKIVQDYTWLEKNLGPLVPMEVVLRFDKTCDMKMVDRLELIREVQDTLVTLPDVGSALSAATFAPKPQPPPKPPKILRPVFRNQERLAKDVYDRQLNKHRKEFIDNDYMSEDENEEVWRISARVGALSDVDYGLFVEDIKSKVEPILAEKRQEGATGVSVVYTGLVPLVYKSQRTLLDGLVVGFALDLALIIFVMMVAVQDVGAGLLLLIPSIFPAAIVFGLMGWMGIVVDVGTVMPPAVALGVTVDDVVHFLLWFRRGLSQGMTRREAVMLAYKDCARPMYQSWGVIGLGLSVFAFSPFTPTQRFGLLMVTLLTASLIGNLLLLPSLLAGPMGWLFAPRLQLRNMRARKQAMQGGVASAPHTPSREEPKAEPSLMRKDTAHRPIKTQAGRDA